MGAGVRGCLLNEVVRAGLIDKDRRELAKQLSERRALKAEGTVSANIPGWQCHVLGTSGKLEWLWRSKLGGEWKGMKSRSKRKLDCKDLGF